MFDLVHKYGFLASFSVLTVGELPEGSEDTEPVVEEGTEEPEKERRSLRKIFADPLGRKRRRKEFQDLLDKKVKEEYGELSEEEVGGPGGIDIIGSDALDEERREEERKERQRKIREAQEIDQKERKFDDYVRKEEEKQHQKDVFGETKEEAEKGEVLEEGVELHEEEKKYDIFEERKRSPYEEIVYLINQIYRDVEGQVISLDVFDKEMKDIMKTNQEYEETAKVKKEVLGEPLEDDKDLLDEFHLKMTRGLTVLEDRSNKVCNDMGVNRGKIDENLEQFYKQINMEEKDELYKEAETEIEIAKDEITTEMPIVLAPDKCIQDVNKLEKMLDTIQINAGTLEESKNQLYEGVDLHDQLRLLTDVELADGTMVIRTHISRKAAALKDEYDKKVEGFKSVREERETYIGTLHSYIMQMNKYIDGISNIRKREELIRKEKIAILEDFQKLE